MKKKLVAFLAAAMVLSGCGGDSKPKGPEGLGNEVDVYNAFINSASELETFNYLNSSAAVDTQVAMNLISGLVDTDKYGVIVGDMAESWTHNEDYTEWTFKIRDNAKWFKRDGTEYAPVVAQDWISSLTWLLTEENGSTCTEMATSHIVNAEEYLNGDITDFSQVGVKAVDDKTLVFTLKNPAPWFDSVLLYGSLFPMNQQFYDEITADGKSFGSSPDTILYNGSYLLSEFVNGQKKTFTANPNYWDAEHVNLKTVNVLVVKDSAISKEMFENGELDYCQLDEAQIIAETRKENELVFKTDPIACSYQIFLNNWCSNENTAKAINNENFRKAIFYGWDREDWVGRQDPIDPTSIYVYSFTPEDFLKISDGTDYTQLPALKPWQEYQYNADKAQEYIEKAKQELSAEGVTFPVELPYWIKAGNESTGQTAEMLKDTFESSFPDFITVSINEYATTASAEVYPDLKHGITGAGWIPDYKDPSNQLGCLVPGPAGYMNNTNEAKPQSGLSHWAYPEFVELYEKACAEVTDIDKRYNLFAEAEAYLYEHAYVIPTYVAGSTYRMAKYNPYSKIFSKTGGTDYRFKGMKVYDQPLTAEQIAQFKEVWLVEREAALKEEAARKVEAITK